jgi:hypothetical protein
LQINVIHNGVRAETLRHSAHIDDLFAVLHLESNCTSTG